MEMEGEKVAISLHLRSSQCWCARSLALCARPAHVWLPGERRERRSGRPTKAPPAAALARCGHLEASELLGLSSCVAGAAAGRRWLLLLLRYINDKCPDRPREFVQSERVFFPFLWLDYAVAPKCERRWLANDAPRRSAARLLARL